MGQLEELKHRWKEQYDAQEINFKVNSPLGFITCDSLKDVTISKDGDIVLTTTLGREFKGNVKGPQGERGPQGLQGIQGVKGEDGTSITAINFDATNRLVIQNSKGFVFTSPELKGPRGEKGDNGRDGVSPQVDNIMTDSTTSTVSAKAIKSYINDLISTLATGTPDYEIVDKLPAKGKTGVLYLVPLANATSGDTYSEHIWLNSLNGFEHLGSTSVDLTNYITKSMLVDFRADVVRQFEDILESALTHFQNSMVSKDVYEEDKKNFVTDNTLTNKCNVIQLQIQNVANAITTLRKDVVMADIALTDVHISNANYAADLIEYLGSKIKVNNTMTVSLDEVLLAVINKLADLEAKL